MLIVTDAADDVSPVLDFSGRAGHVLRAFPKALVGTGFCGAYTTFSTITNEALRLVEDGELLQAAVKRRRRPCTPRAAWLWDWPHEQNRLQLGDR